jgi:signal transduction histidine kinase
MPPTSARLSFVHQWGAASDTLLRGIRAILLAVSLMASPAAHATDTTAPRLTLDQLKRSVWGLDNGAPPNIKAIAQTADGYLWFGTENGLFRFDGITFEQAHRQKGARGQSENIEALYQSSAKILFVGHDWGGASMVRNGVWGSAGPDAPRGDVIKFVGDDRGRVWAAVTNEDKTVIKPWNGSKWLDHDHALRLPTQFRDMAATRDGTLWVASGDGLYIAPPGSGTLTRLPGKIEPNVRLSADSNGHVWLADSNGWRLVDARSGVAAVTGCAGLQPIGDGEIAFDRDNRLWGFDRRGLFRIDIAPGRCRIDFRHVDVHPEDPLLSLAQDREGNLWLGSGAGLQQLRQSSVVPISLPLPRQDSAATDASGPPHVIADGKGALYVRLHRRLFLVSADGAITGAPIELIEHSQPCPARSGGLWVRDRIDRLHLIGSDRPSSVSLPRTWQGRPGRLTCLEDAHRHLWASVEGQGFFRHDPSGWRYFKTDRPDGVIHPFTAAGDAAGNVFTYVGRSDLSRISGDTVSYPLPEKALADDFVNILQPTSIGLLIGGENNLYRLSAGRLERLSVDRFPALRDISGIAERADHTIWMLGDRGLVHVPTDQLAKAFDQPGYAGDRPVLGMLDGLYGLPLANGYSNLVEAADKQLWLTTTLGLYRVNPDKLASNPLPPPVMIRAISGAGFRYLPDAKISLPKGSSRIQIDYTATSLVVPSRVRFRYRLQGVDEGWVDAGAARQASYTNLGPGDYRFTVVAANDSGVWNRQGASVAIHIPPTFRQSLWFKLLILALLLLTLWACYALRVRQIAGAARLKIAAQIAERERIARDLHDTLLQGFQGLVLRLQAVRNHMISGEPAGAMMEDALESADDILMEGRERVHMLRVTAQPFDIVAALGAVARSAVQGTDISVAFDVRGAGSLICAPIADEITRIGGEAFANTVRHANARTIAITIHFERRMLDIIFADDGSGFDAAVRDAGERAGHFGLIGMRERAKQIGASLEITNRPSGGASVAISVPGAVAYAAPLRRRFFG